MAPRSERTTRDDARARAAGYRDYYDYRVHGYGRVPAGVEVSGEDLARARGHRSTSDFVELMRSGRAELVNAVASRRDARGRVTEARVLVTDAAGRTREFRIKGTAAMRAARAKIRRVMGSSSTDHVLVVGSAGALKSLGLG